MAHFVQESRADGRSSMVCGMFDRVSHRYDFNNRLLSLGLDRYWIWRAVRALKLRPDQKVIDLCCGTGALSRALAGAVPQGSVVGVDFSEGMLSKALENSGHSAGGDVYFLKADVLAVPQPSSKFDVATIAYGPRNIVDLQALWKEIIRLVKPGGQVLSLELTRPKGIMGFFHRLYLKYAVPLLGGIFSGDSQAYSYLSTTIAGFLDADELAESMRLGGLVDVRVVPLSGGIVTIHQARTPFC